jgi:tetratricopeptide (TPR) repeat protein
MPTHLPLVIGPYKILKELGRSRWARVYLAQLETKAEAPPVALKVFDPAILDAPEILKPFRRDMRAAAKLKHPHIIGIYEAASDQNTPFIAMEYLTGGTLREKIKKGPLPRAEALYLAQEIGAALSHAHAHKMVHGQIKPENILFDVSQKPARSVLADFGLARVLWLAGAAEAGLSSHVAALDGARPYLAPEQLAQRPSLTPATDIYALAIVLFEMLAGQSPFGLKEPAETDRKYLAQSPPLLSQVVYKLGPFFDDVLVKAMAKRPADRYPSMADFIHDLEAANTEADRAEGTVRQNRAKQAVKLAHNYLKSETYNFDQALGLIEKALKIYPDYAEAQGLRGEIKFKQERFAEGLADYRRAYEQEASLSSPAGLAYLNALRQAAETFWQRQMDTEAVKQYQTIQQILAAGQAQGVSIQAWQKSWAQLVESHHNIGNRAYTVGHQASAGGNLPEIVEAQKLVKREIKALQALQAEVEVRDLQEKEKLLERECQYYEIQRLISLGEYSQALRQLDEAFIRPGHYEYRDVAKLLGQLVYAKQHEGILPSNEVDELTFSNVESPEIESATNTQQSSLEKLLKSNTTVFVIQLLIIAVSVMIGVALEIIIRYLFFQS